MHYNKNARKIDNNNSNFTILLRTGIINSEATQSHIIFSSSYTFC